MSKHKILKSALTVGSMTTLSRIFGYIRDLTLAALLGAGFSMDAFTVAFRIANLLRRLVAEGSMTAAFIPVFTKYKSENEQKKVWDFANKMFFTLAFILTITVVLAIIFAPFIVKCMAPGFEETPGKTAATILLNRIMAPYILFIGLAALAMGILNSLGRFAIPSFAPVLLNISVITCTLLFSSYFKEPAIATAIGALIGGILQIAIQLPLLKKYGMSFRFNISFTHPAIKKVGKLIVPGVFGAGVTQIQLLIGSLLASFLAQGAVSSLYYSDRVMELTLGILVISLATVTLPEMSKRAAKNDINGVKDIVTFSLRLISFGTIPAVFGLIALRTPIIKVLFEHGKFTAADTEATAYALIFYSIGLFFFAGIKVIAPAFYAFHDIKTPVKIAWVSLTVNVVTALVFMHPLKQGGIALGLSIAACVNCLLLLYVFNKRYGTINLKALGFLIVKIMCASTVMAFVCVGIIHLTNFYSHTSILYQVLSLFSAITGGLVTYIVFSFIFRCNEIKDIKKLMSLRKEE
ncbi:MAG: murein biosynthesis integral membrane protein MurJ [Candidatus Ancaeobacter aquaticus]|nr:murein biosynthesis integral membrane protein MurJ [Candidatus Ancaeobacter aquaticus]